MISSDVHFYLWKLKGRREGKEVRGVSGIGISGQTSLNQIL